jgi:hypothetical protein
MELSTHWESITAENSDDNAQLKRDMRYHPRTTGRSLRELARICATAGSFTCQKQLDAAFDWLSEYRSELPREVEDDTGARPSSQRLEITGNDYDDHAANCEEFDEQNGLYDVGGKVCYRPLDAFAPPEYKERGMTVDVYIKAMAKRGEAFGKYYDAKTKRLRWRGMPEYEAVTRATELQNAGVCPSKANSGARQLPPLKRLKELLRYDGNDLTWRISRGRVKAGTKAYTVRGDGKLKTRVDKVAYPTARIIWYMMTGEDPANATVVNVDGDNGNLRRHNLRLETLSTKLSTSGAREAVRATKDSRWEARINIGSKTYTLGHYDTQEIAERAYELAVRTFAKYPC